MIIEKGGVKVAFDSPRLSPLTAPRTSGTLRPGRKARFYGVLGALLGSRERK